ncbi:MAG: prepilin-type N-terminal cleavage/methylation domain-containing protein [Bdellovibrionales bacterium]|nr:prepilin-type N-terminal cleavage/methylation domain-containing protein [Bdellovibrionales bacterium]
MRVHKSGVNIEWTGTKKLRRKRTPKGCSIRENLTQSGFSLIELMVAVGIGTIVALGISTLFIFAVEQFTILVEQNNTEEEMLWASYHTRSFLSQAVQLQTRNATATGGIDYTTPTFNNQGYVVRNYDSQSFFAGDVAGTSIPVDLIAVFARENGFASSAGFAGSSLYNSAIFFQRPLIGLPGKLYFIVGSPTSAAGGSMVPADDQIVYERIVEYAISTVDVPVSGGTPNVSKAATVTITGRYFRTSDRNRQLWCPSANSATAGCGNTVYRDITMTISVGFRNNALLNCADLANTVGCSGTDYRERLHGGLYFYKMAIPPIIN